MGRGAWKKMSTPNPEGHNRRNIRLGILNRAFAEVGKTLADPNIVLSLFVRQLGASNVLVGLLATIRYGGWFLPQFLVADRLQHQARRGRVYVVAELARCVGYAVIAVTIFVMPTSHLLLPLFFGLFAVSYLGHGVGSVPRFDVIGRAIPASARGSFFARSNLIGGLLGFAAGFVVQFLLRSGPGEPPPQRYAWLLLLSITFYALAVVAFRGIRERETAAKEGGPSLIQSLRSIPSMLTGSSGYRRLVGTLLFMDIARRVTDPFYIIFATEVLDAPLSMAGAYLSTVIVAKILSNVLWERLSQRFGNRLILQLSAIASFAVPALTFLFAIASPRLGPSAGYWFAFVFVVMGIRDSGKYIGKRSVFLDLVPEAARPLHWGTLNSVLGLISFLPMLAGTMIDGLGFAVTFGLVSAVSMLGLWSSLRIKSIPSGLEEE